MPLFTASGTVKAACTLEKGDTLVAAVRITDDHGQTTWTRAGGLPLSGHRLCRHAGVDLRFPRLGRPG